MDQSSAPAATGVGIRRQLDVTITGQDSGHRHFSEPAHTELLTRDGGILACFVPLEVGTLITAQLEDRRASARILGITRIKDEEYAYAFALEDATGPAFWQTEFPAHSALPNIMLQCSHCTSQGSLELGEIHRTVLDIARVVALPCRKCGDYTLWHAPIVLEDVELVTGAEVYQQPTTVAPRKRTVNDRRHKRLPIKNTKACLKRTGYPDDIVDVLDVSRGGLRFLSKVDYQPGTRFEVASPYVEGSANLFLPARLARVRSRATADFPGEFALEYVKQG